MDYKKQAFFNTIGNIVYLACIWLLSVVVVRVSGFEDAGVFSIAMSVGNIFYFLGLYGMRSFQAADVTGQYTGRTYIISRLITIGVGLLSCVGYLAVMSFTDSGYPLYTALAILLYLVYRSGDAGSDVIFGELQKDGHLEVCGISMSVKGILSILVFSVLLLFFDLNVALAGISVLALLILVFYDFNRYKALHEEQASPDSGTVKQLLINCFPLLLSTIFPIIITAVPRVSLAQFEGERILGIYASICTPTVLITTIVPNVLCPFMTYYGKLYEAGENKKLFRTFWLSIALTAVFGAVACLAAHFLGDFVMGLLFGEEVLDYLYIFIPIIIATVIYAFSMCGNSVLISIHTNWVVTIFAATALIVSFLITTPLTEAYGMWGTVYAFGLPFLVQFVLQVGYIVYSLLIKKKRGKNLGK